MKYYIITKGMGCPHCIKKVTKAMEVLGAEIEKVELNDIVIFSDKEEADIRAAVESKGFEVVSVKGEKHMCSLPEYEKQIAGLVDYPRWLSADNEAKKAILKAILNFTNDYFDMGTELFFTMPEGFEAAQGLTDPDTGNIRVNAALFDDGAPFLPLFIFLHELRHAIQKERTELFSEEIAMNCSHIIQFDGTGYLVDGDTVITVKLDGEQAFYTELYLGSPAEMDANRFAYDLLRPVCDDEGLHEHYRIWSPSYTLIPKEHMLDEFMKACEQIDRLAAQTQTQG